MAELKRYELLPSEHSSCDTLQEYDAGSLCLYSDTESLRAENERLEAEARDGTSRGNSIGFIYDKMTCYGDQVRMAFNALRTLGWIDDCRDNDQRRISIELWTEETAEKWTAVEQLTAAKEELAAIRNEASELLAILYPKEERSITTLAMLKLFSAYAGEFEQAIEKGLLAFSPGTKAAGTVREMLEQLFMAALSMKEELAEAREDGERLTKGRGEGG